jgi:hypothetical protein
VEILYKKIEDENSSEKISAKMEFCKIDPWPFFGSQTFRGPFSGSEISFQRHSRVARFLLVQKIPKWAK